VTSALQLLWDHLQTWTAVLFGLGTTILVFLISVFNYRKARLERQTAALKHHDAVEEKEKRVQVLSGRAFDYEQLLGAIRIYQSSIFQKQLNLHPENKSTIV
jgi:hypothetical protein